MKKLIQNLKLPVVTGGIGWVGLGKHFLTIIIFTGIGYFLSAIIMGSINGDSWKYVESVEKYYILQAIFLIIGLIFCHLIQIILNKLGDYCFHYWRLDKYFYPIGYILVYLVINEVGGL